MTLNDAARKLAEGAKRINSLSPAAAQAVHAWTEHQQMQIAMNTAATSGNPIQHEQNVGKLIILEELAAEMERVMESKKAQAGPDGAPEEAN